MPSVSLFAESFGLSVGDQVTVLVGVLFVTLDAMDRFNTPSDSRSSTTAFRFHTMQFLYVVASLFLYWVLVRSPGTVASLAKPLAENELYKQLSSPLLAVLFMTLFLPKVPILSDIDRRIRTWLHDLAEIPVEVLRLVARLQGCKWTVEHIPDPQELRRHLVDAGLREQDILFQENSSPQSLWTKLSSILSSLEAWRAADRKASGFLAARDADIRRIQQRYGKLKKSAPDVFDALNERSVRPVDPHHEKMVERMRASFTDDCGDLLHDAYLLIAQMTLHCDSTMEARRRRLRKAGFKPSDEETNGLTIHQLAAVFIVVFLVMMVPMIGFGHEGESLLEALGRVVMIATIYVAAVGWAIFPKKWRAASPEEKTSRPWAGYLLSTLFALVTAAFLSFFFKCLILQSVTEAANEFIGRAPWLMLTASTTFVIALLADNRPDEIKLATLRIQIGPGILRALESVFLGLVNAVVAWCVYLYLPPTVRVQLDPIRVLIVVGLIGLILGLSVPYWYRRARADLAKRRDERGNCTEESPWVVGSVAPAPIG